MSDYTKSISISRPKGKHLTKFAMLMGIKRRWFGLEPDFMLRNRMIKKIKS